MSAGRPALLLTAVGLTLLPSMLVKAAQTLTVMQSRRSFSVTEIRLQRGDSVSFQNADLFLHHVAVLAPGFNSGEQEPGETLVIRFPDAGQFAVRCEIHPRMAMTVLVE